MKELTIEITQRCLNKCIYCSSDAVADSYDFMQTSKIKSILKEAKSLGFENINFSGGEPFLHCHIVDIILFARSLGLKVTVYTSGVILVDDTPHAIPIPTLMQVNCISNLIFNLQASSYKSYEQITGGQQHIAYLIRSMVNASLLGIHTEINFVPMTINMNQFKGVLEIAEEVNASRVNVLKLVPQGRVLDNLYLIPSDKDLDEFLKYASMKHDIEVRVGNSFKECGSPVCTAGRDKIVIRCDGQILSCERYKFQAKDRLNIYACSLQVACDYLSRNVGVYTNGNNV